MKKTNITMLVIAIGAGIYNSSQPFLYHIEVWKSLNEQGMSIFYLLVVTILSLWWLGLAYGISFLGAGMIRNEDKLHMLVIKGVGGSLVGYLFPSFMLSGWFMVITWIYSIL